MYIKEYKQILVIELKDWITITSKKSLKELQEYMESCKDVCLIEWVLFNKYEFRKAYEQKIDWVQSYILTFTKDIQEKLKTREKEKKARIWRWFDDIQEIENYLKENNLICSD